MNNYTIISFYADIPPDKNNKDSYNYYSKNAERLKKQLIDFNLIYDIKELKSHNSYMKNCLMKPGFILSMLKEKQSPVIWIDIDCIINNFPKDFIDEDYDICFVEREKNIPESCFIYFNYTDNSINFLKEWEKISKNSILNLDHLILIELYSKYKNKIKIKTYPWYYASPKNFKEVKILMLSSKFSDKRKIELDIRKKGIK